MGSYQLDPLCDSVNRGLSLVRLAEKLLLHGPLIFKSFIKDLIMITIVQPNGYNLFLASQAYVRDRKVLDMLLDLQIQNLS